MSKKKKALSILALLVLLVFIGGKVVLDRVDENLSTLPTATLDQAQIAGLEDGVYAGRYDVFPISVAVEVKMEQGKMVEIRILEHDNGQGKPAEAILQEIIKKQSLKVDGVTGATYSSKAILLAVEDALSQP